VRYGVIADSVLDELLLSQALPPLSRLRLLFFTLQILLSASPFYAGMLLGHFRIFL
jgi:hypothetical protein